MSNDVTSGYNLFFKFIDAYIHNGFEGIDTRDPLIQELEQMMEKNKQFFFIGDMIQMKIRFTSKRSLQMMGINPNELDPYHLFETTHVDDIHRHGLGRAKAMKIAQSIFTSEKGEALLSTNIRLRNNQGG
jgi:hypothetical protein